MEIAQSPWGVVVDDDISELLSRLHSQTDGAVALVTGRSIESVDELLPFGDIPLAGQHGLEIRLHPGEEVSGSSTVDLIDPVRSRLAKAVTRHPGLVLENKGMSLALHYRRAPQLASYAHRLMRSLRSRYLPEFVIQRGKRVVELKPAGSDKGVAIKEFMMQPPFAGRMPVFAGDDVTDEAGFKVVNSLKGLSIKIGPGKTSARYRISDIAALAAWINSGLDVMTPVDGGRLL